MNTTPASALSAAALRQDLVAACRACQGIGGGAFSLELALTMCLVDAQLTDAERRELVSTVDASLCLMVHRLQAMRSREASLLRFATALAWTHRHLSGLGALPMALPMPGVEPTSLSGTLSRPSPPTTPRAYDTQLSSAAQHLASMPAELTLAAACLGFAPKEHVGPDGTSAFWHDPGPASHAAKALSRSLRERGEVKAERVAGLAVAAVLWVRSSGASAAAQCEAAVPLLRALIAQQELELAMLASRIATTILDLLLPAARARTGRATELWLRKWLCDMLRVVVEDEGVLRQYQTLLSSEMSSPTADAAPLRAPVCPGALFATPRRRASTAEDTPVAGSERIQAAVCKLLAFHDMLKATAQAPLQSRAVVATRMMYALTPSGYRTTGAGLLQPHHHTYHQTTLRQRSDVVTMYLAVVADAEQAVHPHHPLRAAIVVNAADLLACGGEYNRAADLIAQYVEEAAAEPLSILPAAPDAHLLWAHVAAPERSSFSITDARRSAPEALRAAAMLRAAADAGPAFSTLASQGVNEAELEETRFLLRVLQQAHANIVGVVAALVVTAEPQPARPPSAPGRLVAPSKGALV